MLRNAGPGDARPVSWKQVTAFRLARQHLDRRARASDLLRVVADIGGAQAQLLPAAQMSVAARVEGQTVGDLDAAVWEDRTLVRAWCMRRTLYLLPASELAVFVRGSARRAEKEVRWALGKGVPPKTLETWLAAVLRVLDRPLTRSELADGVARALHVTTRPARGGGWGSRRLVPWVRFGKWSLPADYLLHLAGARGVICSGPGDGAKATYVRADAWVPDWRDRPQAQAEQELLRRYLHAFGPANPEDFVAWTRVRLSDAREIWRQESSNLLPVSVEGWPAWVLRDDWPDLSRARAKGPVVRLLPFFDSYLLGHEDRQHFLEASRHTGVFRAQGWIAPVLLVDGRVAGVWSHERKGDRLRIRVAPFGTLSGEVRGRIGEEAREIERFLGCRLERLIFDRAGHAE